MRGPGLGLDRETVMGLYRFNGHKANHKLLTLWMGAALYFIKRENNIFSRLDWLIQWSASRDVKAMDIYTVLVYMHLLSAWI